jgi:hypothetical protein
MDRTRARLLTLALALVYGVSALGYFIAVAQLTAARDGSAETGSTVDGGVAHSS